MIVVRPTFTATPYSGSIYGYIVNSTRGPDVRDVIVDGEVAMRNRKVLTVDVQRAEVKVLRSMNRLWQRLGPSPKEAVEPLGLDPHSLKPKGN
jgi:hypothetical protein